MLPGELSHTSCPGQSKKTAFDTEPSQVQWILGGIPAPTEMEGVPGEQNEIHLKEELKDEL